MELQKPTKEIPFNSISSHSSPQEEKYPTLDPSHKLNNNNNNNNSHSQDPSPSPTLSPGPSPRKEMIRYRECQRNHAAHLGSHVVDGCGEFMPSGEEGSLLALKCAACDCHRNFHRREVEGETTTTTAAAALAAATNSAAAPIMPLPPNNMTAATTTNCYISFRKYHKNNLPIRPSPNNNDTQFPMMNTTAAAAPTPNHHHGRRAPVMMAFGGGGAAAESSSEDLNAYRTGEFDCGRQYMEQYGVSKKRYRTKFSQEQKDKMMAFAEKIGWRMQKQDDVELQRFCHDVGVKRQVFKVWMHNNKQALKKKPT